MIDIAKLKHSDIGRWVEYCGAAGEREKGRIKSWNDTYVFVVYHCAGEWDRYYDFTAEATNPANLFFEEKVMPITPIDENKEDKCK